MHIYTDLASGISVAALLSVFGTLVFWVWVMPRAAAERLDRVMLRTALIGVGVGLVATLAWLVAQAGVLADAESLEKALLAVPLVLSRTWFGHLILLQMAALAALGALLAGRSRRRSALALSGLAVALQTGHSHALAMYEGPSLLLASDVLHLLAAGAWLGGLLPLLLVVRMAPPKIGATASRRFSPLGKLCIAGLAVSAGYQGWVMIASIPGLVGTDYGRMALVKLALFAVLLGFAAANRYRFAPRLLTGEPAKRVLVRSIAVQAGFGVAVIAAAVILSSLPPAMHEQPLWPFAVQLSLEAVREDSDFRREVIAAALALAGAAALLVVAWRVRRVRLPLVGFSVVIACLAAPHFDLLLADANPDSFYHSPTGFAAAGIADGAPLYAAHCAVCHGADGRGDGPAGKTLPIPPADLTAAHLLMHSDGELFWWLSHGIEGPSGALVMPGFAAVLSEDARWQLIDYLRAHNAGAAMRETGMWPNPVRAPDFQALCGGRTVDLAGLRGRFVRLVIGPATPAAGVVTIGTGPGPCTAEDAAVPQAYAIVSGLAPDRLPGTEFLIDGEGWLRAFQRPGADNSWDNPEELAAVIRAMRERPVAASEPMMDMKM